ncbi:hypothetical protein Leryth_006577 [Lithospermum erythrorhizon]|nr:hypothetical protein Leryth_006577 [Lithospermum erythrorhizon]
MNNSRSHVIGNHQNGIKSPIISLHLNFECGRWKKTNTTLSSNVGSHSHAYSILHINLTLVPGLTITTAAASAMLFCQAHKNMRPETNMIIQHKKRLKFCLETPAAFSLSMLDPDGPNPLFMPPSPPLPKGLFPVDGVPFIPVLVVGVELIEMNKPIRPIIQFDSTKEPTPAFLDKANGEVEVSMGTGEVEFLEILFTTDSKAFIVHVCCISRADLGLSL